MKKYLLMLYYFNSNGTYTFLGKNYSEQNNETLLIKESCNYSVNGNNLIINPENNVIEAWRKKNGGDNWNMLKTIRKRPLEKMTYKFAMEEKNLVLQADKETVSVIPAVFQMLGGLPLTTLLIPITSDDWAPTGFFTVSFDLTKEVEIPKLSWGWEDFEK